MDERPVADQAAPTAVTEAILARRSVRSGFTGEPVDRRALDLITRCGDAAPSSKAARPWRFHVVTERATIDAIAGDVDAAPDAASYVPHDPVTGRPDPRWSSTVAESAQVLRDASVAVLVENRGVFGRGRQGLVQAGPEAMAASLVGYGLELVGVGAAVQSMLLAAWSLGLRGLFMGDVLIAEPAIRARLRIEGDLAGVVALGHVGPDHHWPPRAQPAEDAVIWH